MNRVWLKHYPKEVPHEIDPSNYNSIPELFSESCQKYSRRVAYSNFGSQITYEELFQLSTDFASFLQNKAGLKKGDSIAIQMPNVMQYPVVLHAALRAGLRVVNTNPLYTAREMRHQFIDAKVKAIVILANSASHLEEIIKDTAIETVVVTEVGDLLGWPKSLLINSILKYVKKMVPKYTLKNHLGWHEALDLGSKAPFVPAPIEPEDIAFLQYTGGTTGVSKGAMLTHRNIIANMLQVHAWIKPLLKEGEETAVLALPLYHIFSLSVNALTMSYVGATNLMVTNPRDIPGFIKILKKNNFTVFPGLNTLFNAIMNHPDADGINFKQLKISVAGGMALQPSVARRWNKLSQAPIIEGYGLTETSPVACCNPADGTDKVGYIGLPLPSTDIKLLNDDGEEVSNGEPGEIAIFGPQVMKGYWNNPEETKKVMTEDGFFKTGDIAEMDSEGFFKIVDRKKDMILVSGFNVYPNEIEEVVVSMEGILEAAAVGVPDERSTEAVKVFVVAKDKSVSKESIIAHCKENLAGYKVPKEIEFKDELPKTNVGKILRRALRENA